MKKLRLELDELSVESFTADEAPEPRGTVKGNYTTYMWCQYTYDRYNIQCHSVDGNCEPTQYYNETCDPSGPRPCSCPGEL